MWCPKDLVDMGVGVITIVVNGYGHGYGPPWSYLSWTRRAAK